MRFEIVLRREYAYWLELKTGWPIGEILFFLGLVLWPIERAIVMKMRDTFFKQFYNEVFGGE